MTGRIVLIEDDPDVVALLKEMLVELGQDVAATHQRVGDGDGDAEADLVITDLVSMHTFDLEAARGWIARLRRLFPKAAIVVSTAHAPAARAGAAAIGADAVVTKPFDVALFNQTVESLLQR
ncbi:MAG TPA: response regulator [Candidatus Limnocylindria bacterium]|nr:response regulator [Candidatus Limnocylindria bacterium]